jgi:fibronectin type 3 and ankyrin repeat domains protein 1
MKQDTDIIDILIEHNVDINIQNENGRTAVMMAAFIGNINIIKQLRSHGASYTLKDKQNMTVVHFAVDGGHCDTLRYVLMDGGDKFIESKDNNGWTPLLRAASINSTAEIVAVLVKHGADLNAVDNKDKTPIMIATVMGNLGVVKALVQFGSSINIKNKYGRSLYELALSMNRQVIF